MNGVRRRFTVLQRLLHWLMAVCILAMLFIGVGMVSTVMPKYLTLVSIHKPLGIAILVLALIRLVVRLRYGAPPLPADLPEPMKLAAHLSHYAFYVLMIGMPLIGWGMLSAAAYPVVLFGGVHLPAILPQSDSLHTLLWNAHFYLAFAFFALILLHVAAALFHALVRRDGVFEAMASVSTRRRGRARRVTGGPDRRLNRLLPDTGLRITPMRRRLWRRRKCAPERLLWPRCGPSHMRISGQERIGSFGLRDGKKPTSAYGAMRIRGSSWRWASMMESNEVSA